MRRLAILARILVVRLGFAAGRFLPLRPYVVLATAHVPAIRGNLAAIGAELRRRDPVVPIVELVHDSRPGIGGLLRGTLNSVVAGWHLARARVFVVDSHYTPLYVVRRRPGTVVVQTWHACAAIKRIGYSVVDRSFGADETVTGLIRLHANYDLCLAASEAAAIQYVEAFRQPRSLFATDLGIPRTDILCDPVAGATTAARIRERYGIPPGRRVVLHAPTFRGDSLIRARDPGTLDIDALAEALGEDHVLLVRLHPAIRRSLAGRAGGRGAVIDVSDHPEVNELLLAADVLVTDYSSLAFEFALLGRPMVFLAPDIAEYEAERGFYFDYRAVMPGPVVTTTDEVAAAIRAWRWDLERVRAFAATWIEVADGRASARFVDRIVLPGLRGEPIDGWTAGSGSESGGGQPG